MYKQVGSPVEIELLDELREVRHYAIRHSKHHVNDIWKAKMVECIALKRNIDLWQEQNRINRNVRNKPWYINNRTVEDNIADVFAEKYQNIYNQIEHI